jgi:hypothetical protein
MNMLQRLRGSLEISRHSASYTPQAEWCDVYADKLVAVAEAASNYFMLHSVAVPMQPREVELLDALTALDLLEGPE